ncbi:hypothetical protein P175DRAFT_0557524 [Aspergillus ochraceoroseus IBT 24754]|uniref:Uncharacterized protein n=2 Tax=Aspergillus ochraceoroseus TaxID=138278 RepID=A0A2T5LX22_9EURO|nr:uncharacterized protein P175DRAFT_0557524 [Aspergillus ochraceoroseus IBT 24754]KKK12445.1 hypothetical protein AOCH_000439 [Aspergillus ochraceoroseus]PTU20834.1 hypothetical protein P175DRAFT_0557524 [Aspergillus ochraceoroseus IBT 24754]
MASDSNGVFSTRPRTSNDNVPTTNISLASLRSIVPPNRPPTDLDAELCVACMLDDRPRVQDLLSRGADPFFVTESGSSALDLADTMSRIELIKDLLQSLDLETAGLPVLLKAFHAGRSSIVRALLELGMKDHLGDEIFYAGIFGVACCTSTPFVLETLYIYGPEIDLAVYEEIFIHIAMLTGKMENARMVVELARAGARALDVQAESQYRGSWGVDRPVYQHVRTPAPSPSYSPVMFTDFVHDSGSEFEFEIPH